ncbi:hypothetical protein CLG96_02080 [Sphingomonas oleivorans]|uniref:Uncharacterized protein n=1 Tax=Sphingomonas oleivorans TaxID=1735121 RepID=A0A2T5G1C9_9SPHN|nr:hypothetical protein [Sphingomonas oleivorans]PTQ12953.1 hypothetical protein CLG96_02080 [Sphingomonas oleivorans]
MNEPTSRRRPVPASAPAEPTNTAPVATAADASPTDPVPSDGADQSNPAPPVPASALVDARVLVAHGGHQPNDVVALSPDEAAAAEAFGLVDTNPVAVAYAKSLGA